MKQRSVNRNLLDRLFSSDKAISISVVLLGFLCGTLLVVAVGRNPSGMYSAMLQTLTGLDVTIGTWNIRYVGYGSTPAPLESSADYPWPSRPDRAIPTSVPRDQYVVGLTAAQFVRSSGPPGLPGSIWLLALLGRGRAGRGLG
jgi:simple sugar transport system permease protein